MNEITITIKVSEKDQGLSDFLLHKAVGFKTDFHNIPSKIGWSDVTVVRNFDTDFEKEKAQEKTNAT